MASSSSNSSNQSTSSSFSKPIRGNAYRRSNENLDMIAWWCTAVRAHS